MSKGNGPIILIRVPYDMTDYKALRAANRAEYEEKVRLGLVPDPDDLFRSRTSSVTTTVGGEAPSRTIVVARPEGKTSRLSTITKSTAQANMIVRILLLNYLLFLA